MVALASYKKSLLTMVQQVCDELGIPKPSTVIGNTDVNIAQILALANREGSEFWHQAHRLGGWQELRKEYTFSTNGVGSLTGNTTINVTTITGTVTSGITAGWFTTCSAFPTDTYVVSVDSSTQLTMSASATSTNTGISMGFGKQSYSLPSDFGYFLQQTFWDRSYRWQLLGPLDAQEWQVLKSGLSPAGPRRRFRLMGNLFFINPIPTDSTSTEVFEYYSVSWCQSAAGTGQTTWTLDTDYYVLDDDCFMLGLKWRYLAAKRLAYQEEYNSWMARCERMMARNGGNRVLPMNAGPVGPRFLNNSNVPDTGFGS